MEELKHLLGLCGDPHPSLLWLIGFASTILLYAKAGFHICWRKSCNICKNSLNKLIKILK